MLSSNHAFIIENDIPANRWKGGYVFGVWQIFICSVYFHAPWPLTWRARPDRITVVCFKIVGLFDHESPLVVTPLNSLYGSLYVTLCFVLCPFDFGVLSIYFCILSSLFVYMLHILNDAIHEGEPRWRTNEEKKKQRKYISILIHPS